MQHLSVFTGILGKSKGKKQLDCGGVVTTVLAVCARLAAVHGHNDLCGARFQVPPKPFTSYSPFLKSYKLSTCNLYNSYKFSFESEPILDNTHSGEGCHAM